MNDPMSGKKGLWLRQFGDTGEAVNAGSPLDAVRRLSSTLKNYANGSFLALKVADGSSFVGGYDPWTPINSVEDILSIQALLRSFGVELVPVVVPRGRNLDVEADLHGFIAQQTGSLMTDIEPYAYFFDGGSGREPTESLLAGIPEYCGLLRESAGDDAFLVNQPDPRTSAMQAAHTKKVCQYFDALAPQFYVGWNEVGWLDVPKEVTAFRRVQAFGLPVHVTLWGLGSLDVAGRFWNLVKDEASSVHAFTMGNMNEEQLRWFGALDMPKPALKPVDVVDDLTAILDGLTDMEVIARNLADRVTWQAGELRKIRERLVTSS